MVSIGLLFWLLMIFWLVFRCWQNWPNHAAVGGDLLIFILLALLGWRVFGPAIHG